jgi:hypothetical protein
MTAYLARSERQRNFDAVKNDPAMPKAERENVQALIDSMPASAPAWSRSIPSKLPGLYWMRNHGSTPAITYIDRWNDAWSLNGARTQLTEFYLATQDTEFWPEEVHPPSTEARTDPLMESLRLLSARFKVMYESREKVSREYADRGDHRIAKQMGRTAAVYAICNNELIRVIEGEKPYPPGHDWPELPEPTETKDTCDFCRGKGVLINPNGLCALCFEPETTTAGEEGQ